MRRQAQRQLSAGGMPGDDEPIEVEVETCALLAQKAVRGPNIFEGTRPPSTGIPHAAVLGIEGCDACGTQRLAEMPGMSEIVARAPVAAVDVQ